MILAVGVALTVPNPSQADVLDEHTSAFDDDAGPQPDGSWSGSTAFSDGDLSGTVDWAVFGPGDFPFSNYTPTSGELTYAFQVFSTGTDAISKFSLNLPNTANNIGSFSDLTGDAVTSTSLSVGVNAQWNFAGITQSNNSEGLAISSIRTPINSFGLVLNGGGFSAVIPLPTPSLEEVPEPSTLGIIGLGSLLLMRRRRPRVDCGSTSE